MLGNLANWLLACSHRNTSFPITFKKKGASQKPLQPVETYVVCLDCGKRFVYDWAAMRLIKKPGARARELQPESEPVKSELFPAANRFFQRLVHHTR